MNLRNKKNIIPLLIILTVVILLQIYSKLNARDNRPTLVEKSLHSVLENVNEWFPIKGEENEGEYKKILFWHKWFGGQDWLDSIRYNHGSPEELKNIGCPIWKCHFTTNRSELGTADAVVFGSTWFSRKNLPPTRTINQRWIWVEGEAPRAGPARTTTNNVNHMNADGIYINWTFTYHSNADLVAYYGYFVSKMEKTMPIRPNLMINHPATMKRYLDHYNNGTTLKDIMGNYWLHYVTRPKLVAWMSSHCNTYSNRLQYIQELEKYVPVDKYGACGTEMCRPSFPRDSCFERFGLQNLFYLSMENDICNEYITEKLYFALVYNLVPIVWGGSDYSRFLPPGSYINAREYHPKDLAELLLKLQKDPVEYGRYHVWRGFFEPRMYTSYCELCHKLHTDKSHKTYQNISIGNWRNENNQCMNVPKVLFNDTIDPDAWKIPINASKYKTHHVSTTPGQKPTHL